jgi:hypothetical protein
MEPNIEVVQGDHSSPTRALASDAWFGAPSPYDLGGTPNPLLP